LVINPILRKVNYDPLTSFEPVCYLLSSPQVVVVNSTSPYKTLGDLLAAARAKPGELTFASVGPATTQHIGIELIKHAANVNLTHIPYTGGAPAINALLGGHVTAVFASYPNVAEQVAAGKLRALTTAARERLREIPNVPTLAEAGFKDIEADIWFGVVAPAKTPADTTAELARWFTAALDVADIKAKLAVQGMLPVATCGTAFGAFIRQQHEDYGRAIRDANIKVQ
jgi:tripartite-type tricarboxylate transporter receptor subunit TctC